MILLISVFLSWTTYKFVEQPIRLSKDKKNLVFILIISLCSTIFISNYIIKNNGYPSRQPNIENSLSLPAKMNENFLKLKINCSSALGKKFSNTLKDSYCMSNSLNPEFLVIGDSHAVSFTHSAGVEKDLDIAMIYLSSQPAFLNYVSYGTSYNKNQRIERYLTNI
ncbi:MAG: hypothetical protein RCG15_08930 [Candidatus Rickettsia vulgarisii]